jgi:hypothetical protein
MDFRAYQSLGVAMPQHEKQPPDGQINMHTGQHAMFLPQDLDAATGEWVYDRNGEATAGAGCGCASIAQPLSRGSALRQWRHRPAPVVT